MTLADMRYGAPSTSRPSASLADQDVRLPPALSAAAKEGRRSGEAVSPDTGTSGTEERYQGNRTVVPVEPVRGTSGTGQWYH